MKSAAATVAATCFISFIATDAQARETKQQTIQHAKQRYYHADGYIKAIGKNARRTIYNPKHQVRMKWKRDLHYLVQMRTKAWETLHPPKPKPRLPDFLLSAFTCIHHYEGAWNANTGNGYYGGLQFGWKEWQRFGGQYAPRADLASPAEQIQAAIAYWKLSGFNPWPNTARACGLL